MDGHGYSSIGETIEKNGFYLSVPHGSSMWPLFKSRQDSIVFAPRPEKLRKYDIPLYKRQNGKYVVHRIMKIYGDGTYGLCGDNELRIEKGIRESDIIGIADGYYRNDDYRDFSSAAYRLYLFFWCRLFYLRVPVIAAYSVYRKIKNKIKH